MTGYYRRGDLAAGLVPATYFIHGLAGYTPTVVSPHSLQAAAFLSAGVDPLTYAAIPAYGAAQLQRSAYDAVASNVGSDTATTSELSPGSTQNGVDTNGASNYTPPGYGMTSRHWSCANIQNFESNWIVTWVFVSVQNEYNYSKFSNTYRHQFVTYWTEWRRFFTLATTPSHQQNQQTWSCLLAHYGPSSTETTTVRCHKNSWIVEFI